MRAFATLLVATAMMAGCSQPEPPPPAAGTAPVAPPALDDTGVTQRYACQADTYVAMLEDGSARVELPGGQRVSVSRIAGSTPVVYTGQSLYFTIDEGGARLSQEGQASELACVAQPAM